MKAYKKTLLLAVVTGLLFATAMPCWAVEKEGKDIWSEDKPKFRSGKFELTEKKIEWIMNRLKQADPEKAKELEKLRQEEPEKFKAELRKAKRELFHKRHGDKGEFRKDKGRSLCRGERGKHGMKKNPELAAIRKQDEQLKKQRGDLVTKIRSAPDKEKQQLTAELEKVVSSRFDLIVKRKQIRYQHLQKKLEKLQRRIKQKEAELDRYPQAKDEKVKHRIQQLLTQSEQFNWD